MDYILESDILVKIQNNFGDKKKISPFFYAKKINIIKLQYIKGIFHYIEK